MCTNPFALTASTLAFQAGALEKKKKKEARLWQDDMEAKILHLKCKEQGFSNYLTHFPNKQQDSGVQTARFQGQLCSSLGENHVLPY